jgi:thiamine biosynthesis lipoprotein
MTTRRRFLSITAAAFGCGVAGLASGAPAAPVSFWKGTVFGAPGSLTLVHPDRDRARALIAECVREIARLENIFSLYRAHSSISELNRAGELRHPPHELVELMSFALALARDTGGAFDPTVQPLYRLYARHFSLPHAAPGGPSRGEIERALRAVDFRAVEVDASRIALRKAGMALSLNGVAQGYITDRIADRLHNAGFGDVLVDLGETRALGVGPGRVPWSAGIADPRQRGAVIARLTLGDDARLYPALATSGGYGMQFGDDPSFHHLFDPHTGRSAHRWLSVSVEATRATLADGLSTSLAVMTRESAAALLALHRPARAYVADAQGSLSVLGSERAVV